MTARERIEELHAEAEKLRTETPSDVIRLHAYSKGQAHGFWKALCVIAEDEAKTCGECGLRGIKTRDGVCTDSGWCRREIRDTGVIGCYAAPNDAYGCPDWEAKEETRSFELTAMEAELARSCIAKVISRAQIEAGIDGEGVDEARAALATIRSAMEKLTWEAKPSGDEN